ncbi:MAG: trimethylamine methyltransferase family protein, partial [Acidobacteria bacterium]|nr:trimethylamine methyltransferase family protein [Acidobacteriota bacterium]
EESLALDLIDRVGPGGHFLTEDHTLAHFRDVFYSKLFDRSIVQNWVEAGSKTFDTRLKDLTVQAMEHKPEPLPAKVIASFDAMQKKWK